MEFADPGDVGAAVNTIQDKWNLLPAFYRVRGLVKQHVDSFDHFVTVGLKKIINANQFVYSEADPNFYLKYLDISVGKPELEDRSDRFGRKVSITPHECRLRDLTYSAPIRVDVEYIKGGRKVLKKGHVIGRLPIMLRSANCVLGGKAPFEMVSMNECPLDPGGYFIVNGIERVILIQEQLSMNRMFVERDAKGSVVCHVIGFNGERMSRTDVIIKKECFYLKHKFLTHVIPVAVVFKAMGFECEQEIVQLVGAESQFCDVFERSLFFCHQEKIFTQEQALKFISIRLLWKQVLSLPDEKIRIKEARDFLANAILVHIPVERYNFKVKGVYLALMIRRMIQAQQNPDLLDDRQYYGNVMLKLAGSMLACLFEDLFKIYNSDLKRLSNKIIPRVGGAPFDIVLHMRPDQITNGLVYAISTGNWTLRSFKMEPGCVTQVLSRLSYLSCLGMMTRVCRRIPKSSTFSSPRTLHLSQWGMFCPCDTPEGDGCGLNKNLALMTHITTDVEEEPLVRLCYILGLEDVHLMNGESLSHHLTYIVFLNGKIIGAVRDYEYLMRTFRLLRRRGRINEFVSICCTKKLRHVLIASDGGRVCRPYIIVQNGRSRVEERHILELLQKLRSFDDFVHDGLVEFLDVNEENDSLIAVYEADIKQATTHLEIEPFTLLGVCAGLIPYPDHNQSPRNVYQCMMGRQAMGSIGYNQHLRIDSEMFLLVYPQVPLVKTRTIELINFEKLPAGQNAIVAVMSYSGYDIEDALVLNKASLDRGFGRCVVYRTSKCSVNENAADTVSILNGPLLRAETGKPLQEHKTLEDDGITAVGSRVEDGHILINKFVSNVTSVEKQDAAADVPRRIDFRSLANVYHGSVPAYVDKVMLTASAKKSYLIKVLLRQTRRPELGDKFSSRHGQKGVVGLIAQQEDLPFDDQGMCPDIVMNPHGFPSRMTVGKLMELLAGKAAALEGKFHYGTAFGGSKMKDVSEELIKHGFNYQGKDYMTSGITGEPLCAYIFFGPVYYQKLKHMVMDKMYARSHGPKVVLTGQPPAGRVNKGGIRFGEMERDCLVSYGASNLLLERMMLSSDVFKMDVCNTCGRLAYCGWCNFCRSSQHVSTMKVPYACKLLLQELQSMNIVPKLALRKYCD